MAFNERGADVGYDAVHGAEFGQQKTFTHRHHMTTIEPAEYINLDLDLKSPHDLTPLATHLSKVAFVLHNDKIGDVYRLIAEPAIEGRLNQDPQACTEEFLNIFGELPEELVAILRACTSRTFDYGFDGGSESPPLSITLPAAHLAQMAKWNIDVQVTIYPYSAVPPTEE